jgi:hypothetical protein
MRLRVKDIDFDNRQIILRDGKGENDRLQQAHSMASTQSLEIYFLHLSWPMFSLMIVVGCRAKRHNAAW